MSLFRNVFKDLIRQRERTIPGERRKRRQIRRDALQERKRAKNETFAEKIKRAFVLFQYNPVVRNVLRDYNSALYSGKGRVRKGERSDIQWPHKLYPLARKADAFWTLCALRDIEDEAVSHEEERWEPLVVVGIDTNDKTFIVDNTVIPLNQNRLQRHLEKMAGRRPMHHRFIVWTDSPALEGIGGLFLFAIIFEIISALLVLGTTEGNLSTLIETKPLALAVILAGAVFTVGYLIDIAVYLGALLGGGALTAVLCAMLTDSRLLIVGGAGLGVLFVLRNFFTDIILAKSDDLSEPILLRKEDWLYPVLYGTRLSNAVLTPFNFAIGAVKGAFVALLTTVKVAPLLFAIWLLWRFIWWFLRLIWG
jgi:hypothetical protein